jgi:hypothetical protein
VEEFREKRTLSFVSAAEKSGEIRAGGAARAPVQPGSVQDRDGRTERLDWGCQILGGEERVGWNNA